MTQSRWSSMLAMSAVVAFSLALTSGCKEESSAPAPAAPAGHQDAAHDAAAQLKDAAHEGAEAAKEAASDTQEAAGEAAKAAEEAMP